MAKQTRLKKEAVKLFKDALERRKYPAYGTVARVVLEAIIFDDGRLTSETFYLSRAGKQGTFTQIRSRLEKDGFIRVLEPSGRIVATKRLEKAIQVAKSTIAVTMGYVTEYVDTRVGAVNSRVDQVVDDVQDLRAQVHEICELLSQLRVLQQPPPSEEAQRQSAEIVERLDILMLKKAPPGNRH